MRSVVFASCRKLSQVVARGGRAALVGGRARALALGLAPLVGSGDHGVMRVLGTGLAAAHAVPTNVGYSLLLLVHVGAAVLGFGAMVLTGAQARRAGRGPADPAADGVRRYFRPGVNWAARSLYLVPVFGFALLADSGGAFQAGNGFVVWGLFLWLVAVLTAEMVVWPGERRIQQVVSKWADPADAATAAEFDRDCRRVATASAVLCAVFVVAFVIMIAKP